MIARLIDRPNPIPPALVVNSGLKYVQKRIQLAFMRRLSHNLHEHYTTARAYYAASTLGGEVRRLGPAHAAQWHTGYSVATVA